MVWLLQKVFASLAILRPSCFASEAFGGCKDGWRSKQFTSTGGFLMDFLSPHFLRQGLDFRNVLQCAVYLGMCDFHRKIAADHMMRCIFYAFLGGWRLFDLHGASCIYCILIPSK